MKGLSYNKINKYIVNVTCTAPLHIGNAYGGQEEVLVHPDTGNPFVQATSIAGVFHSYCNTIDEELAEKLFGSAKAEGQNDQSRVRFTDGLFQSDVKMELRPHVKINRKTGSVASENKSGQKFNIEYIGAGAEFQFEIYLYTDKKDEAIKNMLEQAIAAMKTGRLQFGAKKSNGVGKAVLQSLAYKEFDLTTDAGRTAWGKEDELDIAKYDQKYADTLSADESAYIAYSIKVDATTENYIQVKGIAVNSFGKDAPDSTNMQNANKDYIIPGSSFKGSIRSQVEKIADYMGKGNMVEQLFGTENQVDATGMTGNVIFSETIIGDKASNDAMPIQKRIHIDKFTGGVFQQGLFSEKNAAGDMELQIDVLKKNHPEASLGLLIYALRDLAIQTMNLGSGYNVGKGFILVDNIVITRMSDKKQATLTFAGVPSVEDEDGVLAAAVNALKAMEG